MSGNEALVNDHYGFGGILEQIKSSLESAGKDLTSLNVDDLAPVDEFHTRGREGTLELAELANVTADTSILDVGCGLGGTARHLAETYGCKIVGIDLTDEYIEVGTELTDWVGLGDKVTLKQGSALELPFEDNSFDMTWTEHVQMNIPQKEKFYSEMARVLKPGGLMLFHDIFRGTGEDAVYPCPWAEEASISHLAPEDEIKEAISKAGLTLKQWINKDEESLEFFRKVKAKIAESGLPPLGIHLLMGETSKAKIDNYMTNLEENRTSVVIGVAQKG